MVSSIDNSMSATRMGHVAWVGADDSNGYGPTLGWFSIALGAIELLAPRELTRSIGLRPSDATTALVQAMGVREIAAGVGILANPRSKEWLGMRVAGDVLDLALLGVAALKSERPQRTLLAAAAVSAVTALDVIATETLSERRKQPEARAPAEPRVQRSATLGCSPEEAYAYWREVRNLPKFMRHVRSVEPLDERRSLWTVGAGRATVRWESEITEERKNELIRWRTTGPHGIDHQGEVRFAPAAHGSTVVTVTMEYAPPGGRIAAALLKLMRKEPGQLLGDDLRRFKQLLETGEVLLSDASAGRTPRHAQPLPKPATTSTPADAEVTP